MRKSIQLDRSRGLSATSQTPSSPRVSRLRSTSRAGYRAVRSAIKCTRHHAARSSVSPAKTEIAGSSARLTQRRGSSRSAVHFLAMKRLVRDPFRFDGFSLFATYGQKASVSLKDPASVGGFIAAVKASAERALSNEAFLFGQRTEALFERVVASLGGCRLLKREDVGDVFHTAETDVQPPVFRSVWEEGKQLLVGVKTSHQGAAPRKQQRES